MKDINVGRMFSERIQISHRTEAFEKNLSRKTIYGTGNAQIDFRVESKEPTSHLERIFVLCTRHTTLTMNDQIDSCSKMYRGVYRKDTMLDLYATKNPLRYLRR